MKASMAFIVLMNASEPCILAKMKFKMLLNGLWMREKKKELREWLKSEAKHYWLKLKL